MPFDPVRDAVLNSPLNNTIHLPSPVTSTSPTRSASPSYFNHVPQSQSQSQSPSSSRRATDLSVLLNSEDQPPTSPFQQRPSSSAGSVAAIAVVSPSLSTSTGTPRPRSAHLSHILQQPSSDDASPSPVLPPSAVNANTNAYVNVNAYENVHVSAATVSPSASPLSRHREMLLLGPSTSRSRAAPPPASPITILSANTNANATATFQQPDFFRRRTSSLSASGSKSESRSPEMPRTPLNNSNTMVSHDIPPPTSASTAGFPSPPPVPMRQQQRRLTRPPSIPYAPKQRRTKPDSVLIPLSEDEREFYKNLTKNPLKAKIEGGNNVKNGKRKFEDLSNDTLLLRRRNEHPMKLTQDVGLVVQHYNQRPDVGVTQRQQSPIIGLKNFNNWVKSVLIARFAHPALHPDEKKPLKRGQDGTVQFVGSSGLGRVLDMGCGKGGDLNKWQKAKVGEYVGVDIAAISVEQAYKRYLNSVAANPVKSSSSQFKAHFFPLDCFSHSLTEIPNLQLPPHAPPFDVVSMQFCMHYAFESVQKARVMLENVTRWLRQGGRFVGTIPNDRLLLERLDALPADYDRSDLSFGNSVYRVRFDDRERRPVFGHRYFFFLRDAVDDVPEYVVHWDNFVQMASEYHLKLLYKAEFHDVYAEHCEHPEYGQLLQRMKVVDANGESQMDEDQWEAANVYIAFAFEKV